MKMQESEKQKRILKRVADTTRSWRCVEDEVNMLLQCFDAISAALAALSVISTDSTTTTNAQGLLKLLDFGGDCVPNHWSVFTDLAVNLR